MFRTKYFSLKYSVQLLYMYANTNKPKNMNEESTKNVLNTEYCFIIPTCMKKKIFRNKYC